MKEPLWAYIEKELIVDGEMVLYVIVKLYCWVIVV